MKNYKKRLRQEEIRKKFQEEKVKSFDEQLVVEARQAGIAEAKTLGQKARRPKTTLRFPDLWEGYGKHEKKKEEHN